jgi:hypothetical protein
MLSELGLSAMVAGKEDGVSQEMRNSTMSGSLAL